MIGILDTIQYHAHGAEPIHNVVQMQAMNAGASYILQLLPPVALPCNEMYIVYCSYYTLAQYRAMKWISYTAATAHWRSTVL